MKTKLFYVSALALIAASCSQTEMEQLGQNPNIKDEGKGIAFIANVNSDAETRGDFEQSGNLFYGKWFADKDAIGVFYKNNTSVKPMHSATGQNVNSGSWMGLLENSTETQAFKFRASASGNNGYFVADSEDDMLALSGSWTDINKPTFRAFYPYNEKDYVATSNITLPDFSNVNQETADGYGVMNKMFFVSESSFEGEYDANDNSVAKDRFNLDLKRVHPVVWYQVKIGDLSVTNEVYKRDYPFGFDSRYGKLKTVTLKAKGNNEKSINPSKLTFNSDDAWDIAYDELIISSAISDKTIANPKGFVKGSADDAQEAITVNLNNGAGLEWADNYTVFMPVANIDRTEFVENDVDETMSATYTFEKIQIQKDKDTRSNAWTGDAWVAYPSSKGYELYEDNYTVYMNGSDYVLEINKDFNLAEVFDASGYVTNTKKGDGNNIAKSEIKHFVSKVALNDDADYAFIRTMTGLTNITLLENEEIPAGAFSGLSNLVYLNLPKVTTVGDNAFPDNKYTDVYMGSYNFEDEEGTNQLDVRNTLLKAESLERADISGVTTIGVLFVQNQYPTFMNFTKLQEIKVQDNVILATAAFRGCEALTKVDGTVVLNATSNSQFANCVQLATININGTVIPEAAFSGCKLLTTVSNGDAAVVPSYIGESAFAQTKLSDIDLSTATTIGKSAFEGCTSLTGGDDKTLTVGAATHISDRAFYGCNQLQNITFEAATSIGADILNTASAIKKIEFKQVFKLNTTPTKEVWCFGSVTNTKQLFCHKDQPGVEFPIGGSPKINLTNEQGGATYTYTFMSIDKKYGYQ